MLADHQPDLDLLLDTILGIGTPRRITQEANCLGLTVHFEPIMTVWARQSPHFRVSPASRGRGMALRVSSRHALVAVSVAPR